MFGLLLDCKVVVRGRQGDSSEAVIIGGMVLDIHATPSIHANPGTTAPGKVCQYSLPPLHNQNECCLSFLQCNK